MIDGYRYRDYLDQRKTAATTANLINGIGSLKKTIRVDDLVGYWADGRVLGKMEFHEHSKRKAIAAKRGR